MDRPANNSGRLGVRPGRPGERKISNQTLPDSSAVANSAEYEPSEVSPALIPLRDSKDAPYTPIATLFRHSGFTFIQLKRIGNGAIYKQSKGKQPAAFEVVRIREYEAYAAFGKEIPAAEYYPKSEDWGTYGFTYCTLEEALAKFAELTNEQQVRRSE